MNLKIILLFHCQQNNVIIKKVKLQSKKGHIHGNRFEAGIADGMTAYRGRQCNILYEALWEAVSRTWHPSLISGNQRTGYPMKAQLGHACPKRASGWHTKDSHKLFLLNIPLKCDICHCKIHKVNPQEQQNAF